MAGIDIDTYLCSGCATCVVLCPEAFRLSAITGKAELVDPDQAVTERVREAAVYCPERCILLPDEEATDTPP